MVRYDARYYVLCSMLHYGHTKKESFKCAFQCGKGSSIVIPERQGKNVCIVNTVCVSGE
jgi:hypothetical protein